MTVRLRRRMAVVALARLFRPGTPGVGQRLRAVPRMVRATLRGHYDGRGRLAMVAVSVLYLVSPLDFLADVVFLVVGVIGDAALVTWLVGAVLDESERFLTWERTPQMGAQRSRGPEAPATRARSGIVEPVSAYGDEYRTPYG